ncbi:helix-turn-helix domain-containing protein [Spongiactinospora sp. 9N601]|uniref:helix-turn-helix domain-containing protein n=1 Tax=Spongiactinospora sp. 9N601 TaxID=3375149 RepID=UPI00378BDFE6
MTPRHVSRHRLRRNARRMRRDGIQPIASVTDDLVIAPLVIVTIGRLAWRFRSALAPWWVMAALAAAALVLHTAYPSWWWSVPTLAAVLAVAVAVGGRWVGLTRGIERGYAATVLVGAGGWVTAGTLAHPFTPPLPAVLVVGGVITAVPWWAHRRRRARVRVERTLAAWPDIAQTIGLAGSRIQSAVIDVWGYRARLALARGQTAEDAIAKIGAIESALGTRRGAVRVQPLPDRADRADVRVIETDPHADAIPWPGPSVTSITQPLKLGVFEDGGPVRVSLLRRHALVGGVAGAGKSGGVNVIMGELSACPDVIIWGIDLKAGMELRPWEPCLGRLATTPRQATDLLADAVAVLDGRADALARRGLRVWDPSPDAPALVILIDEYAELADDAAEAMRYADSIARRGRAPAVTLIAATQRPSQKAMGQGAVRSQMDVRVSMRVRERRDVDLILGSGMLKAGWGAHLLDAPGKFLVSATEHDVPRRGRTFLLTDAAVQETAERHADRRPALDAVSAAALEAATEAAEAAGAAESAVEPPEGRPATGGRHARERGRESATEALWAALAAASDAGVSLGDLITATGMSRPTVYRHLAALETQGRVIRVGRARWRVATPESDSE